MQLRPERFGLILKWAEYGYAGLLIFTLTQGPVLSLWYASEQQGLSPAIGPHLATYFLIQIPALLAVSRKRFTNRDLKGPMGVLAIFCLWLIASTVWATNGQHSIVESVSLFTTFICGIYFSKSFNLLEKLTVIVVAMQPGLLISRFAISRNWSLSTSIEKYWVGIYFNRNSLAPVAMVSVISASALFYLIYKHKANRFRTYKLFLLADAILFGFVVVIRTGSNNPFGGLLAFVSVFMFWETIRRSPLKKFLKVDKSKNNLFVFFTALVTAGSWIAVQFQAKILGLFGETVDFNGRSEIWKYSWNGFLERPFLGWGWLSAWRSWAFMRMNFWWTVEGVVWSHNAYLDLLLGGGVLAVVLFGIAVVWGSYRLIPTHPDNPIESWPIAFLFFYLAMCTQESFIIGNHFLWMLFVAILTSTTTISTQQDQSLTV